MAHSRIPRSRILSFALIFAFGVGVLATAGFAAFAGERTPEREPPRASTRIGAAERIAADIAELREGNRAALDALHNASADVDELEAEWNAAAPDQPAATKRPTEPKPKVAKPKVSKPKVSKPKTNETSTHRPIEIDDDRDPLAGAR